MRAVNQIRKKVVGLVESFSNFIFKGARNLKDATNISSFKKPTFKTLLKLHQAICFWHLYKRKPSVLHFSSFTIISFKKTKQKQSRSWMLSREKQTELCSEAFVLLPQMVPKQYVHLQIISLFKYTYVLLVWNEKLHIFIDSFEHIIHSVCQWVLSPLWNECRLCRIANRCVICVRFKLLYWCKHTYDTILILSQCMGMFFLPLDQF